MTDDLLETAGDVKFTPIGISGRGLLALGHGQLEAIHAAFAQYARERWGAQLPPLGSAELVRTWVAAVTDCGAVGDPDHGTRDCQACLSPDWAAEYRIRHDHSCWLCAVIAAAPWWLTGLFDPPSAHANAPGFFPVTLLRDPADVVAEQAWAIPVESTVDAA